MSLLERPQLSILKIGDRVLVMNVLERGGPGNLRRYWEQAIYEIVSVRLSKF